MGSPEEAVVGLRPYLLASMPYLAVLIGMYGLHNAWLAMVSYHALALLALGRRADWSLLRRGWRLGVGLAVTAFCGLAGLALYLAYPVASREGLVLSETLSAYGVPHNGWWFFIYYCVLTPPVEEMLWRDRLATEARGVTRFDLLFAGYHLLVLTPFLEPLWLGVAFASLAFASCLWRYTRRATGGLAIAVISHFVADITVMYAIYQLAW